MLLARKGAQAGIIHSSSLPYNDLIGIVELILIALSHVIFMLSMVTYFDMPLLTKEAAHFKWIFIPYGATLGIAIMGVSYLACGVNMKLCELFFPNSSPKGLDQWMVISRGGWIRHHLQVFRNLPMAYTLLIVTMQIGSEEIIFRGVFFSELTKYSLPFGFFYSLFLFVFMQSFQMNSKYGAMFPMTGALVMGIIHNLLYFWEPSITPLIISHLTFFLFSVL